MSFVRAANPIWYMVDNAGTPLNDQYWAFFFENIAPYSFQAVYQDPGHTTPWSNPIQFNPSGTLPNNLYFDPSKTYRIEIRMGSSQTDPLIWQINNFVPNGGSGSGSITNFGGLNNIVVNPQFADVNFTSPLTITTAGTYDIAPGWQLVLVGASGSTTVTQTLISGVSGIAGNPPSEIQFTNTGWTSATLRQSLPGNGALFAGGSVALYLLASTNTNPHNLSVNFVPSNMPGNYTNLFNGSIATGALTAYSNVANINVSNNTDTINAYVNLDFVLPITSDLFSISNIQLLGKETVKSATDVSPVFQETSYPQQVTQEFYYYRNSLLYSSKNSLLTGWNFGNNPWQFANPANVTAVPLNQYVTDQTIVIQQNYVAVGTGANVIVNRGSAAQDYGLLVTAVNAHNQFAILQYIDPATVRQYWGGVVSCMVKASIVSSHATNVRVKARLIYINALPNPVVQNDPINTWPISTDPTVTGSYNLLSPNVDNAYTLTTTPTQLEFNEFVLPPSGGANMTLGLLIYTIDDMNNAATADAILINDVSLVPNAVALPTQAETFDETLRKCQYYYEQSFPFNYVAGVSASTNLGAKIVAQQCPYNGVTNEVLQPYSFDLQYQQVKRSVPVITFYSVYTTNVRPVTVTNTVNSITAVILRNGIATPPASGNNPSNGLTTGVGQLWGLTLATNYNVQVLAVQGASTLASLAYTPGDEAALIYQYVADARLGV